MRRLGVLMAMGAALLPALAAPPKPAQKLDEFNGRVRPLSAVVKPLGLTADAENQPLILVGEDGKSLVLLRDAGSRMFFKDERLLDRPVRLTGRFVPEAGVLQVLRVHGLKDGKLIDIFYWCDVCSIRRLEKGICDCCGGPMELREEPVGK